MRARYGSVNDNTILESLVMDVLCYILWAELSFKGLFV